MSKIFIRSIGASTRFFICTAVILTGCLLLFISNASAQKRSAAALGNYEAGESESRFSVSDLFAPEGLGIWTKNGPFNVRLNDGTYSHINDRTVIVASGSGNVVYAGGNGDGVYRSLDGGTTWTSVNTGLPLDSQGRVDFDPDNLAISLSNSSIIYAATCCGTFYRTDNGGASWISIYHSGIPFTSRNPLILAVHPTNPNIVYAGLTAGSPSGLYVSTNGGADWTAASAGLPSYFVRAIAINPNNPDIMFAGVKSSNDLSGLGIYKSVNAGASWTAANNGLPVNADVESIRISLQNSSVVYAALSNDSANGTNRVYRSGDGGATWIAAGNGLGTNALVLDVAVDAVNPNLVYAATYTTGVYKTTNGGQNWTAFNNGLVSTTTNGLALSSAGGQLHVGTAAGVWDITDNGSSGCTYGLSPTAPPTVPAAGGAGSVTVTAGTGCTWTAASNAAWLTITGGASGSGNGTVSYSAAANTGVARSGTLTVAGQTFTLNQSAAVITPAVRKQFDFDGDGRADVSVFRPSNGVWYLQQSTSGFTGAQFGISTDKLVPADYDGDGKTDLAVVRNGTWYIQRSTAGFYGTAFGNADDVPVPADYDGDGKADVAVFRPNNGTWYLQQSTNGFVGIQLGVGTDKPVPGDYNGDGRAEVAVYRPSNGTWYLSTNPATGFGGVVFGASTDILVPADYDGDGKTDIAVFRPSNGSWYIQRSTAGFVGVQFGLGTDIPVPADYDGDGKADIAVVRNGSWYLNRSTAGFTGITFGFGDDKPIPNSFVR